MFVGGGCGTSIANERVLVNDEARRSPEFHRAAGRRVVDQILVKIIRAAQKRRRAEDAAGRIEAAIAEHADIVAVAVGFDAVVAHVIEIIVVEINGRGDAISGLVGSAIRHSISSDVNAVVPVGGVIVFIGRHVPNKSWVGTARNGPSSRNPPELLGGPNGSEYAVKLYGQGRTLRTRI